MPEAPKFGVVKKSDLPREEQRKRAEKPPLRQNLGDLLRQAYAARDARKA